MQKGIAGALLKKRTSGAQEIGLCMYIIQMHCCKVTAKPGGCQIGRRDATEALKH